MSTADENPSRITVSRDALRADLAEMELRLRTYFNDQLRQKAESAAVLSLDARVRQMEQHGSSQAQEGIHAVNMLRGQVEELIASRQVNEALASRNTVLEGLNSEAALSQRALIAAVASIAVAICLGIANILITVL